MKFRCLLIFPLLVTCLQAATVDDLTFTLNGAGTEYSITDCLTSASGDVVIPSVYQGLPVTSVGSYAFFDCTSLSSITISNSVTSIGSFAFSNCSNLVSTTIPDSVNSIGEGAFNYCTSLASITIPDGVTSIGDATFFFCSDLTSIIIPNSVTSIGYAAFNYCASLTNITIGDSVTSIGIGAFSSCSGVTSITIPDSVTSIGDYAFSVCTSLTSITLEGDAPIFGADVFLDSDLVTVYYDSSNSGWINTDSTIAGKPAVDTYSPLLEALWAAEAERDAAILERDAAILERDAAIAARDARPTQAAYSAVVAARDARPTQEAYDAVVAERDARLTESEVRDLKLGSSMLEVVEGEASINMVLEATDNLGITSPTWTPVPESKVVIHPDYQSDKIRIDVEADDVSNRGIRFFRFKMDDSDSSNYDINLSIGESEYDEAAIIEALAKQYGVPADSISLTITSG